MQTRTAKRIGAATAMTAIAFAAPVAVTAQAEPPPEPTPVAEIPDPQGPGCDAFKESLPAFKQLAAEPVGDVLAAIPDISTFYSAISGGLNPAVNIVPVLNNGPYVVFAPTNEAFAALPPGQLDALTADPAVLTDLVYYHAFLGLLGPDDVKGQRPSQQGTELEVSGEGGDITVNDESAKVVCGGIQASNARIYLIDAVLDLSTAPDPIVPTTTSATETPPELAPAEAPAETTEPAPAETTEPAPAETTELAPAETTELAPAEAPPA